MSGHWWVDTGSGWGAGSGSHLGPDFHGNATEEAVQEALERARRDSSDGPRLSIVDSPEVLPQRDPETDRFLL